MLLNKTVVIEIRGCVKTRSRSIATRPSSKATRRKTGTCASAVLLWIVHDEPRCSGSALLSILRMRHGLTWLRSKERRRCATNLITPSQKKLQSRTFRYKCFVRCMNAFRLSVFVIMQYNVFFFRTNRINYYYITARRECLF